MKYDPNIITFVVDEKGEISDQQFQGKFSAKLRLTHKEQLMVDREYRKLIGDKPEHATLRSKNQADVISQLYIRVVDSPSWWRESDNGLDLLDDNVVAAIYTKITETVAKEDAEKIEKAKEAAEQLKKIEIPEEDDE